MRISDWSSDVCSSDLSTRRTRRRSAATRPDMAKAQLVVAYAGASFSRPMPNKALTGEVIYKLATCFACKSTHLLDRKSTRLNSSSLMRISYAVFCLKKKKKHITLQTEYALININTIQI